MPSGVCRRRCVLRQSADVSLQHASGVVQTLAKLGYGKETEDEYYIERKKRIVELQGRYERLSELLAQYTDAARCECCQSLCDARLKRCMSARMHIRMVTQRHG